MANINSISARRTQIYLPEEMYSALKKTARQRGLSMAAVIRGALRAKVFSMSEEESQKRDWDDLMGLAGIIKRGPRDMSENISKYISRLYKK